MLIVEHLGKTEKIKITLILFDIQQFQLLPCSSQSLPSEVMT